MTLSEVPYPHDKEAQEVFEEMRYGPPAREVGKCLSAKGYIKLINAGFPDEPKEVKRLLRGEFANVAEAMEEAVEMYGTKAPYVTKVWALLLKGGFIAVLYLDDGHVLTFAPPKGYV